MNLGAHSPVFIVLLPLSASLLCLALSRLHKHLGAWVVQLSILGAFISSVASLREVLACDPRPGYQDDPDRVYGFAYGDRDVRFTVRDGVVTVCGAEKLN